MGAWCSDLLGDHVALALSPGLELGRVSTLPGCRLAGTGRGGGNWCRREPSAERRGQSKVLKMFSSCSLLERFLKNLWFLGKNHPELTLVGTAVLGKGWSFPKIRKIELLYDSTVR